MTAHDHGHSHSHGQSGATRQRLAIAFGITAGILVAEIIGSILTGSLALLVDAAHMLTDAGGLAVALLAAGLVRRPATTRRTWGYGRAEVIAAAAQAGVLLAVGLFVLVEGVRRLFEAPQVPPTTLLVFGIIGLVGNVASIVVLASSRSHNLNLRAAFLEVVNDALGSIAVIAAAIVIRLTGWGGADAVAAILIGVLILPRAFRLLGEAVDVLLESTPRGLDLDAVREHLLALDHVQSVHDLHASQIATGLPVLTAHVVIDNECFTDGHSPQLLDELQQCVAGHFNVSVEHSTFQLEPVTHRSHESPTHD
ncbi:cation diffusion facilitator family transporter [Galbitalea soli]|uniref:Cation transporter n=1 Tax=Galbitalea soli TaxID=1268042 RepID=A0A7C9PL49_9MICO|nr:cation diffusion facilitator family transporter [Galbitalea soli]NEM89791.1 cation transporter [Galbitalea soli]NYJ30495.1 cobalt-zinc-cadmium efflux system protein [Galbitalea soli]